MMPASLFDHVPYRGSPFRIGLLPNSLTADHHTRSRQVRPASNMLCTEIVARTNSTPGTVDNPTDSSAEQLVVQTCFDGSQLPLPIPQAV